MNENVYPAALIARTTLPSPFPSCCRLPRRFMLQFSSEPVGSVSKPTVPLRSPPHRHPLAVPRVHRRANRRGVHCRVDFFYFISSNVRSNAPFPRMLHQVFPGTPHVSPHANLRILQPSTRPVCRRHRRPVCRPDHRPAHRPVCRPDHRPAHRPEGQPAHRPEGQPDRRPDRRSQAGRAMLCGTRATTSTRSRRWE